MAFFSAEGRDVAGGEGAEGDALVEFDAVADDDGLADDDAGAVVDEVKEAGPMVAPGWMSMPVRVWAYSVMMRGMRGTLFLWSSWAMR